MLQSRLRQLGRLIAQQRNERGLSLRAVEKCTDIPTTTLWQLEHGQVQKPNPIYLSRLARALDVRVSDYYLLTGYTALETPPTLKELARARYGLTEDQAEQLEAIARAMQKEGGSRHQ